MGDPNLESTPTATLETTSVPTPEPTPSVTPPTPAESPSNANVEKPRSMSDLLARTEPPAEPVAASEPTPVIQQTEEAQKVADLKAERDLTLKGSLGDLTQADRKKIEEIDKNLASLNTVNEPVPSYLGTPQGWDAETPSATPQVLNITQEVKAAEPIISAISHSPEPVITATPKPGFVNRLRGLFVGRKPQSSGI